MAPQESGPKHTQIIHFNFNRHIHVIVHLTTYTDTSSNQIKGLSFLLFRRHCCPAQSNKIKKTLKQQQQQQQQKKKYYKRTKEKNDIVVRRVKAKILRNEVKKSLFPKIKC